MRFVYLFTILSASQFVSAQSRLPGTWPEQDTPTPPNVTWTEAVRKLPSRDATIVQSCPQPNDWALTFDDGPSTVTPSVLDELAKARMKATFFVVGSRIIQNPSILRRAYQEGHQIALHSWSHADFGKLTEEQIISDVMWDMKAVYDVIGVYPKYFRVPYGSSSPTILSVLGKFGLTMVNWSRDTNDWTAVGNSSFNLNSIATNFQQWANEKLSTGTISLQHDLHSVTTGPVPRVLTILADARYNMKTVGECLGDANPYSKTNVVLEAAGAQGQGPSTPGTNSKDSNDVTQASTVSGALTTIFMGLTAFTMLF